MLPQVADVPEATAVVFTFVVMAFINVVRALAMVAHHPAREVMMPVLFHAVPSGQDEAHPAGAPAAMRLVDSAATAAS
jgi:hypothetical protein